jgi:Domain of unknown function (DUF4157)
MKATYTRRRRPPAHRYMAPHKGSQREPLFFGETATTAFFQPAVQRKCAACEGEEKVHKKEGIGTVTAQSNTAGNYIGAINGKGQAMDKQTRSFYENRMGADFGNVKIHTGQEAAASAKDINAQAYAYGNHIVFGEGNYRPETNEGKHLLAHELAHVVQQNGSTVNGKLQRQVGPAPRYRNCTTAVTGNNLSNDILDISIARARVYVGYAISLLQSPPVPGSVYAQALARHFGHPITDGGRATIRGIYQRMLPTLTQSRIMCNLRACDRSIDAFFESSDSMIHICRRFWFYHGVCRAIVLIHEGAHSAGINLSPQRRHNPNRGQSGYPGVGAQERHGVSRTQQVSNPDA